VTFAFPCLILAELSKITVVLEDFWSEVVVDL